ncbi:MAG: exodeoxyribonuclease VII large subunit [Clostridia bacterium]|nr:exodeoxyribonuclease VII large subunit [Clostridia bacterium]
MEINNILTVEQLNNYIKDCLDSSPLLKNVSVKGEISNCGVHTASGHMYFTLKDGNSLIKAVMFRMNVQKLNFKPENGLKVICTGRVAVFVRDGTYQIYAESMEPDGIGSLYIAFEQLKEKLRKEGLFDQEHKKKLPKIPFRVGVITSPTGAAVRDIINISGRRFPAAKIILYPCTVQGNTAAPMLTEAINYFDRTASADVIIIGRGGGSIEDLWAFNDETLARAIYNCRIPVVSAVGHETDFTICDFVSDVRAPTPSAAAEIALPDSANINKMLGNVIRRMNSILFLKLDNGRKLLETLSASRALKEPGTYFDDKKMYVAALEGRLGNAFERKYSRSCAALESMSAKLGALDPLAVLKRGYAAVFSESGSVINSEKQIKNGETFTLELSDGSLKALRKD